MAFMSDHQSKQCHPPISTSACYDIHISGTGKACIHDIDVKHSGSLLLVPGGAMDDSRLTCLCPAVKIDIPPCTTCMTKNLNVAIGKPCKPTCKPHPQDCQCSMPCHPCAMECIWTSTCKQANVSAARIGEIIRYTIAFTNHSSFELDKVRIFDSGSEDIHVIPHSIYPSPAPGETLETGISLGPIKPRCSTLLTYKARVDACATKCIANRAFAEYFYTDCNGCCQCGVGSCKDCIVNIIPDNTQMEVCQCIQNFFPICDFRCFEHCHVYHTGTTYDNTPFGHRINVGYGIAIKYINGNSEPLEICHEGRLLFLGLSCLFNPDRFTMQFSDLRCEIDACDKVAATFAATLCYW